MGRVSVQGMPTPSHRVLACKWAHMNIISAYGPVHEPDYEWVDETSHWAEQLADDNVFIMQLPQDAPLADRWRRWHSRAEQACRSAVTRGLAIITRRAERDNGSFPTQKRTAPGKAHFPEESILMRRLKRIRRRLMERTRALDSSSLHVPSDVSRPWNRLAQIHDWCKATRATTASQLFETLDHSIAAEARIASQDKSEKWRAHMETTDPDFWKYARSVVKPPAFEAQFSAQELRSDWQPHWEPSTPRDPEPLISKWQEYSSAHPQCQSPKDASWLPN